MNNTLDNEKNILGLILVKESLLDTDFLSLDKSYFDNTNNKHIFNTICKLRMNNIKVDIVSISEQLKEDKLLDKVGGRAYINDLALNAPETVFAKFQFNILEKNYQLRQIHNIGYMITEKVKQGINPDELISDSLDKLNSLIIKESDNETFKLQDNVQTMVQEYSKKEEKELFYTSYPDLDEILQGSEKGDLVIIGARPSIGKSVLRGCFTISAYHQMIPVHLFTLEMSKERELDRLLANLCEINISKFKTRQFSDTELSVINFKTNEILSDMDLTIYDKPACDVSYIRSKLLSEYKRRGKLGLVIIDHMHLMSGKGRDLREKYSNIASELKQMALEFNCYMVVLSQLKRKEYINPKTGETVSPKPTLSDLKESGDIEACANTVMLIHREDRESTRAEIIVDKNRDGGIGSCYLNFYGQWSKFTSSPIKHL